MKPADLPTLIDATRCNGKLFLDGQWQSAAAQRTVAEPATGQRWADVAIANAEEMHAAIGRARTAQAAWAATAPRERAAVLLRAAQVLQLHFDEGALAIARETGGIVPKGQHEMKEAVVICQLAAALPMQAQGQVLPSTPGRLSLATRVPHGVVGVISPFNFPLILGIRAVAPALALGNAVVLKPDPRTPIAGGVIIAEAFAQAGLPAGLLQVLTGDAEAGEALVTDPRVPMIAFTGSPGVGRRIGELAGRHLKKVSLELGGANNLVVLDDADLDAAASAIAFGAWFHQGQICMASNRVLVHEAIAGRDPRTARREGHAPAGGRRRERPGRARPADRREAAAALRRHRQGHGAPGRQARGRRHARRALLQADRAVRRQARHARLRRGAVRPARQPGHLPHRRRGRRAGQPQPGRPRRAR